MQSVAMIPVLLVMLAGCAFSYPMNPKEGYLEYLAEMAASKGRDMLGGARGDGAFDDVFYGGSAKDYSAQYKAMAIQALEQQMRNGGGGQAVPGAQLAEEESTMWNGGLTELPDWDVPASAGIGQVGGVAVCPEGFPHVFHRADRTWHSGSFDVNNVYKDRTPIENNTLVTLNAETGEVVDAWGSGTFYLPHGLTIDHEGNLWFTDVALHQVLKYSPKKELLMTLGEAFQPATDEQDKMRFCEPTDVAVASNGDFFVADGYCNRRVAKFDASGKFLGDFGQQEGLSVPHSLALLEKYDAICVADRENERIMCYGAGLKTPEDQGVLLRSYSDESMGRVYSIAYSPEDDLLYGVGMGDETSPRGFTIDVSEEQGYYTDTVSSWAPKEGFTFPHAMALSPDGENVYVGELYVGEDKNHRLWKLVKAEQPKEEDMEQELEEEASPDEEEEEEEEEEKEEEEEEEKKDAE